MITARPRRHPRRRWVGLLCLGVGAALLAGAAWAFWTGNGSGAAPAAATTLVDPGTPTLSQSNGTVTVSWTAATAPGAGTVDYFVQRRDEVGTTWVDACGTTPSSRLTALTCDDVPGAGAYVWQVTAYFSSWMATSDESEGLAVDNPDHTLPTGSLTAPFASASVRASVTVSSDSADADSGVANASFQRPPHGVNTWTTIDVPDTTAPYAVTWDTTTVTDGLYDLRVVTTDNVGNSFTSPLVTNVRVDNTAPTLGVALAGSPTGALKTGSSVYFKSDAAGTFGFVATVTDAGSGAASAAFPLLTATNWTTHSAETMTTPSGGPYASNPFTWSAGATAPGSYMITATDVAGNVSTATISIVDDATAPAGAVTAPASGANVRATVSVTASVTDAGAGVQQAQFQTSPAGAGTWSNLGAADTTSPYSTSWVTTGFTDGLYDLRVVTTDNLGNSTASATITNVRVDNTAPAVSLALASSPTGAYKPGTVVFFKANAAGSFGLVATVTDGGSGAASATFPILTATSWTTHTAETVSTPTGGPYASTSFVWASGALARRFH